MMQGVGQRELRLVEPESWNLDQLYRRFAPYVAAIGNRLLGRPDDVDDLVQDVFLEAERGLASVRDPKAIKGWLATIAVRKARRRLKRRRLRRWVGLDDEPKAREVMVALPRQEHRVLFGRIYLALDELAPDDRIAWTLRYIEGEKLEDVARITGCSLATAKRRIAKAQAMVKELTRDE
ncbi:MAG: sigma-70 family RNA polymerase sigma factor [Myxococcota bacterium]